MSGPFPAGHKFINTDLNPVVLGWVDFLAWYGTTLAYVSADAPTFVFSINADVTGVVEAGMRIKLTQTTDKFFIVTAVGAFAAGVTPITVYGGTDYTLANAAISAGAFSTHKKPFGFNASPAKWTETLTDTTSRLQASPVSGTWYNPGSLSLAIPIGVWFAEWSAPLEMQAGGDADCYGTLSTANNSESDADFTAIFRNAISGSSGATLGRRKAIPITVKTSYFLNAKVDAGGITTAGFRGDTNKTIVRAVCAYL